MLLRPTEVKHVRRAAAAALLVVLAAGCGAEGGAEDRAEDRAEDGARPDAGSTETGPVVAHPSEGDGSGMTALVAGPLTMVRGCLMVGEFPVVWPHGTTWDAEDRTVQLADGQAVGLGDRVSGGGGYPHRSDLGAEFAEPLADCPTNTWEEIAMFNPGESIDVSR